MLPIAVISLGLALYLTRELKRAEFHLDRERPTLTFEQVEAAQWGLRGRRTGIAAFLFTGAITLLIALDPEGMAGVGQIIGWVVSRLMH